MAKLRLDCKRIGPEAVRRHFCPADFVKFKSKSPERDGDRVIYGGEGVENPFERVEEFLEMLDE